MVGFFFFFFRFRASSFSWVRAGEEEKKGDSSFPCPFVPLVWLLSPTLRSSTTAGVVVCQDTSIGDGKHESVTSPIGERDGVVTATRSCSFRFFFFRFRLMSLSSVA